MKTIYLFLTLSSLAHLAIAQAPSSQLDPAKLPRSVSQFVPAGFVALYATRGNLNLDAIDDVVLIVKKPNEAKTSDVNDHPEKRPLLILIGQAGGTYRLAGRNDNTVYCVDCGGVMGDPFTGVVIKNGYFSVEHYGGSSQRWGRIITYRYNPAEKSWLLSRDGLITFSATDPDLQTTQAKTSKDFGRVPFSAFDIYKE